VLSASLDELKSSMKRLVLTFPEPAATRFEVEGLLSVEAAGRQARLIVRRHSDETIAQVKRYQPQSITVEDLSLEDMFVALSGRPDMIRKVLLSNLQSPISGRTRRLLWKEFASRGRSRWRRC